MTYILIAFFSLAGETDVEFADREVNRIVNLIKR